MNRLYYSQQIVQSQELNFVLVWLNSLIYKLQTVTIITTCRFTESTRLLINRLTTVFTQPTDVVGLSTQSADRLSRSSFKSTYVNLLLLHLPHKQNISSSRRKGEVKKTDKKYKNRLQRETATEVGCAGEQLVSSAHRLRLLLVL